MKKCAKAIRASLVELFGLFLVLLVIQWLQDVGTESADPPESAPISWDRDSSLSFLFVPARRDP